MNLLRKATKQREFFIFLIVLFIIVIMSATSPIFRNSGNISSLFLSISIQVIIAVGMTNLMVSGGFDMSVGSVVGFTGAATAMAIKAGVPVVVAVLCGILIGAIAGFFNGFIISKLGINAFVTTLASLSIFRGLTLIITKGSNKSGLGNSFDSIGQNYLFHIQAPIWYALVLVIVGDILLRKSRFFRQNYYIGGNEKAARLSGINVDRIKILNYVIVGALAGVAGIVMTSRFGSANVTQGTGLELQVITAVIVGGASLQGGEGTILGAFLGALLMTLITNVLTLIGVNVYYQTFVVGATLLIAVLIDQYGKTRKLKVKTN